MLRAVDDLLVEVGYARVTMKAIAERAGVSRQTVYRWLSSPAEVLLEASLADATSALRVKAGSPSSMATEFHARLSSFLTSSDAGLAYRALLGAAQHDRDVAALLRSSPDPLRDAAWPIARALRGPGASYDEVMAEAYALLGPTLYRVMSSSGEDSHLT